MILMIDNYDSFTYNLVQMIQTLGKPVFVRRNNQASISDLEAMKPAALVISPGPGTPYDAGISMEAIRQFGRTGSPFWEYASAINPWPPRSAVR